jgi:hypothetical protein
MHMNRIWLVLSVFLTIGICTAEVPDLIGNWTASASGYFEEGDSYKLRENISIRYDIIEQTDRLFTGNVILTVNGNEMTEKFSGVIGWDNKTLYIAESIDGYNFGTIISDDEFELIHLVDGGTAAAARGMFHRAKG